MVARVRARFVPFAWIALAALAACSSEEPAPGTNTTCPAGTVAQGAMCSPVQAGPGGAAGMTGAGSGGALANAGAGGPMASAGTGGAMTGAGASGTVPATAGTMAQPAPSGAGAPAVDAGQGTPSEPTDPSGTSGCGATDWPAAGMQMLDVNGTAREFIVELPANYDPNTPYKLIFAWHGLGGTASRIASSGFYGLRQRAEGTAIFVAGQGLQTSNSVGSGPGWDNMGGRDVAFTQAMLDHLRASYCIDDTRIFSTGMSYGGIMSNTVGCALGDQFRAIAPIAGSGPLRFGGTTCTGQVAAWLAHGNQDTIVAFSSGERSRDHWVQANGCDAATQPVGSNGCVAYQGCADGFPVVWCEFDGGHTVPSFASAEIWAFFSQF